MLIISNSIPSERITILLISKFIKTNTKYLKNQFFTIKHNGGWEVERVYKSVGFPNMFFFLASASKVRNH